MEEVLLRLQNQESRPLIPCRACGAPGHKAFVPPISLIIGSSICSASMIFPEFQQQIPTADLVREGRGCETKEKQAINSSLGAGFPIKEYAQQYL